jgi:hypothetical protein
MTTKTKLALAALLILGVASAAQAGSKDDADATGGYAVGPLGQSFRGGGDTGNAFGYLPSARPDIRTGKCWEMTVNGHYAWADCQ